jgi:mono/diheme cytochrome c family protein
MKSKSRERIGMGLGLAVLTIIAIAGAQGPPGAVGGRGGGTRAGRFKIYPQEAISRGLPAYNTACGYCHGERGKGGKAGPDLIVSLITLHDEDGVQIGQYLKGPAHTKAVKPEVPDNQVFDIAAYLHSRVQFASGRGDVHMDMILVGDPKAGEVYFNGAGGCNKCHSPTGNLKGVGAKYDPATLQERMVMPRVGRGGFGRGATADPNAPYATVTLPSGQTVKGAPVRVTDFDVVIRLADGSTQTWARNHGIPKVELTDPLQAHIDIMTKLKDFDMHNLTAYLATLK